MGNCLSRYLGTPEASQPAEERWSLQPGPASRAQARDHCRVQYVYRQRWVRTQALPSVPPGWSYAQIRRALVPEAWRRFPNGLTPQSTVGPDLSHSRLAYMKRWLWSARNPRPIRSPVTVKIAAPQRPGSIYRSPPAEESPDPCATESVPRALRPCQKGKRKFDGPLWFEVPDPKLRKKGPEPRPSAFSPMSGNGVVPVFVPRPGPLIADPRRSGAESQRRMGLRPPGALPAACPICQGSSAAAAAAPPQPGARPPPAGPAT
ncbi:POM121-like protein 12 [Lemur catta]|uniref:POM121-like protein 12 n=1 Tax=Lemur catta TaxID=9447 RepID=UPI001E26C276|nr:POM121-like protein 12 [Lemur catta]